MTATMDRIAPPVTSAPTSNRRHPAGLLVAVTALAPVAWGLTYLVTTELLPPAQPLTNGAVRALTAGAVLALLAPSRPTGVWWWRAAVLGTLNVGAFFALLFVAADRLPGGVAATLGAIQPLVVAGLAVVVLGERAQAATLVAGALGIGGVALLVLRADAQLDAVGVVAGLGGALSMATGVVLTKRWVRPVGLLTFTSWQLLAGGALLAPLALAVDGVPAVPTAGNLAGYAWFATAGTSVAYVLWFRGIGLLPVGRVSVLALVSPLVATIAGWAVLGQAFTLTQLLGAGLVLTAVLLAGRAPRTPHAVR
jgi:probable blue pigment (indigoidine) exporter